MYTYYESNAINPMKPKTKRIGKDSRREKIMGEK
jgi:hypothetical protein